MIHLKERHFKIIKDILSKYPYTFYAFGSRVKGTHREFSDLDLCYKEPINPKDLVKITMAFEDSDLPFKVDIVNFSRVSKSFQDLILKDMEPLTLK